MRCSAAQAALAATACGNHATLSSRSRAIRSTDTVSRLSITHDSMPQ